MGYFNTIGLWERWAGSVQSPTLRKAELQPCSQQPSSWEFSLHTHLCILSHAFFLHLFICFLGVGCTHDGDICVVVVRGQFGEVRTFAIQILGVKFITAGLGKRPYPRIHPSGFVTVFVIVIGYSYCNIFRDWLRDK